MELKESKFLNAIPIKTMIYETETNLVDFILNHVENLDLEGKVLAITSKIVSISENCIVDQKSISKNDLVRKEADIYIGEGGYGVELTIKHGLLIPSAGIDESNSKNNNYILYPKDPYLSAKDIYLEIKRKKNLKNFGIILTDSHTTPLRKGVSGIALSHWGFQAIDSKVGVPDLFGKPLKYTHINIVDSLAVAAVLVMGEASERTPLAIIESNQVVFSEKTSSEEIKISPEEDLYNPLLKNYIVK